MPARLPDRPLEFARRGQAAHLQFRWEGEGGGIPVLMTRLTEIGVEFTDLETSTEHAGRHLRQPHRSGSRMKIRRRSTNRASPQSIAPKWGGW